VKTYFFTIAAGDVYRAHAERLHASLRALGASLDILVPGAPGSMAAKRLKIAGILNAPRDCERIIYLDADTFALDLDGIDAVEGSWRIPWRMPVESYFPRTLDAHWCAQRLQAFYRTHGLTELDEGGSLEGVEWNSGVIAGSRDAMLVLAEQWGLWWDRVLDLFHGHFRRDQVSYRIAYRKVCEARGMAALPAEYNWVASYFGVNPNAHILHRTMVRGVPWLDEEWNRMVSRKLAGIDVRTANRRFDGVGILSGRPSLLRREEAGGEIEAGLLGQTLNFSQARRVLLCGIDSHDRRFLPIAGAHGAETLCVVSPEAAQADRRGFDLVVFCAMDYRLAPEVKQCFGADTVFCFAGIHDMALYRELYEFRYVRILAEGFGVFSDSRRIVSWPYRLLQPAGGVEGGRM
jgi:hypothetical protein